MEVQSRIRRPFPSFSRKQKHPMHIYRITNRIMNKKKFTQLSLFLLSMPHKTLSTTGKTENTDRQGCEKKGRQTFSTFCLDFGWIRGDGIGGLQRAGRIETSQRAKNARKGA